jgi:hypothetical protein
VTSRLLPCLLVCLAAADAAAQVPRPPRRGRKVAVKIDSSPQQAAIYLDDKQYGIVGYTPYKGTLVKGSYKLILELPGYRALGQTIAVNTNDHEFFFPLEKTGGSIEVQTAGDANVAGATIYFDGEAKGTAPNSADASEGRHLVELKKPGFGDFAQWVTIKAGERVTLTPVLKGGTRGSLLVDADVPGSTVIVDGKKLDDPTPAIVDALDEGQHTVEVQARDGRSWKQSVAVKAGQRTKVVAELRAGVTARVLANVADAEIFVDGTDRGKAPVDVPGLAPGQHIVTARAPGYADKDVTVVVEPGKSLVTKIDLVPGVSGPSGTVQITGPAGAAVFIDGASVGQAPVERIVAVGEHVVVLQKEGFARVEKKVTVPEGQTLPISAELRPVAGLRILSSPDGATILLDGQPIGKTPFVGEDIPAGDHVLAFRAPGYKDQQQPVTLAGGQMAVVSAELHPSSELTPEEAAALRRALSSYGALTVPTGHVTLDTSAGYPYYIEVRATTGIPISGLAADVAFTFRTLLTNYDFLLTARLRVASMSPFAVAAFATVGGGGGANGRNQFSFDLGAVGSILFAGVATVSARVFVDVWSDRLCQSGTPTEGPDVCTGKASPDDLAQAQKLHGSMDLTSRDTGGRLMTSIIGEVGLSESVGFFIVFEGAPFQDQRAAFSSLFTTTLLSQTDPIWSLRLGLTFKF